MSCYRYKINMDKVFDTDMLLPQAHTFVICL